jgi:6-phosphogluconolactonase (cycloisomerase 2 family)
VTFSPRGNLAALTILQGSYDAVPSAWFRKEVGRATLLAVGTDKVRIVNSVDVGAFPEGIAFAADGVHIYAGNYHSNSISVLKVDGAGRLVDMGQSVKLLGPPASLRIGSR